MTLVDLMAVNWVDARPRQLSVWHLQNYFCNLYSRRWPICASIRAINSGLARERDGKGLEGVANF